jgi:hypothetical protein
MLMLTLIDCNHIDYQDLVVKLMGLLIFLGGMSFERTAMSQEQIAIDGIETPANIQSPSLAKKQTEDSEYYPSPLLSIEQLEELVGPVALYPDDLIGIIIPASTYPLQVVQAARYLKQHEQDPDLKINDKWDDSIVALLNYPEVLKMMDEDLDWTWELGAAVVNQQDDVMDAIQVFRQRALAAGNLDSDDKQIVSNEGGTIEVKPANPEVIYVPTYVPKEVIVYQTVPVYHYYPVGYPVYYYPYGPDYRFRTRFFWGLASAFYIGWNTHYINAFPYDYYRHPYYGSTFYFDYYGNYYQRPRRHHHHHATKHVNKHNRAGAADHRWRPSHRNSGARPRLANNSTHNHRTGSHNRKTANNQLNKVENTARKNQRINGTKRLPANRLASTQPSLKPDQNTRVQRRTNTNRIGRTARINQPSSNTFRLPVKRLANIQPTLKTDQNTRVQRRTNTNRIGRTALNNQRINRTKSLPAKRSASTQPTLKTDQNTRVQRRTNTNRIGRTALNNQRINRTKSIPAKRSASTQPTLKTDQNTRVQRRTNTNKIERTVHNNKRTRNSNGKHSGLQTLARTDTAANNQSRSQSYRGSRAQKRTLRHGSGKQSRSARSFNSFHR